MLASAIINMVAEQLQDADMEAWTPKEHVQRINAAQKAVIDAKPEASTITKNIDLSAGSKHAIASGDRRLLKITRNTGADGATIGRTVTEGNKTLLDMFDPDWHDETPVAEIEEYMLDERNPTEFWSYPPADGTTKVEGLVVEEPDDIVSLDDSISIPDKYANALREYVLYLCFTRDSELTPNPVRAEYHLQNFANHLGVQLQNSMRVSSNNPANKT